MVRLPVTRTLTLLAPMLVLVVGVIRPLTAQTTPEDQAAFVQALHAHPQFVQSMLDRNSLVAQVGDQAIFAGDLLHVINAAFVQYQGKFPEDELDLQRVMAMRSLLKRKIEEKLIYLDFLRTAPADKQQEMLASVTKQVNDQFYAEQVEKLMQQFEVQSLAELDEKLKKIGSSLDMQKADFRDQAISQFMVSRHVDRAPEVTFDELLAAYLKRQDTYAIHAKSRWEQLSVLFEQTPDKAEAERIICEMGNQVLMGKPLATVAKELSQDPSAIDGGQHDWINQGSLKSEVLDQALFTLPIGQLSRVLEDEQGFHIVRVLERHPAGRVSFAEAQDELRTDLQSTKRQEALREYLEKLRGRTYIWTAFDDLLTGK